MHMLRENTSQSMSRKISFHQVKESRNRNDLSTGRLAIFPCLWKQSTGMPSHYFQISFNFPILNVEQNDRSILRYNHVAAVTCSLFGSMTLKMSSCYYQHRRKDEHNLELRRKIKKIKHLYRFMICNAIKSHNVAVS